MNQVLFICISIFTIMAFLGGCSGQLAVKQTIADPTVLTPGKEATLFVIFKGPKNTVAEVVATVREAPDFNFPLNDKGEDGDVKAGDNIWSREVTVPLDAPSDTYHLEILAKDTDGNEIITPGLEQQQFGRSGSVEVVVE